MSSVISHRQAPSQPSCLWLRVEAFASEFCYTWNKEGAFRPRHCENAGSATADGETASCSEFLFCLLARDC